MDRVTDWLGDADKLVELGRQLRLAGVPADRLALYRRTLHPEILGRATAWAPDRPVEIFDRQHGLDLSAGFSGSPLDRTMTEETGCALTRRDLMGGGWRWAEVVQDEELSELRLVPLSRAAALAVGTCSKAGFSESDLALLDRLAAALKKGSGRRLTAANR
jgi:adenylate cyclase